MSGRRVSETITAIAIDKDKNSKQVFKWAIENVVKDSPQCVLLHVQRENLQHDNHEDTSQFFLPFRGFCALKGIIAKEVVLQDVNIPNAIVEYITTNSIANIVVGASSRISFLKKFKSPDVATTLLKTTPETCAVFVVSKGKLLKSKSASQSQKLFRPQNLSSLLYNSTSSSDSERTSTSSLESIQTNKPESYLSQSNSPHISPPESMSEISQSETDNGSCNLVSNLSSYTISETSITNRSSDSSTSMESLLQQVNFSRFGLETSRLDEAIELPKALSERETQKRQSEIQADEITKRIAKMDSQKRRLLEMQANLEKDRKVNTASYKRYSIKDVEDATNGFSDAQKIGEGGYGPVYKGVLDNISVAIKILKSGITQGLKQFQQEIEVLSSMRHPNIVILLGTCPELGSLVYEYMENGTLEDRLFCKNNTIPLSWRARFRIAAEIATGLLFLHQAKPEPIVHRDLKPANILLDRNFTSKICDVGIARLVPSSMSSSLSNYHMTSAAGTFFYIDPEYQQTGMLGVKSDLYSFGVVLLQIITAMPAMGLAHKVEVAIENNNLRDVLDPKVPEWPEEETLELAKLALQCCELRKKDRPDLALVLLPALNRLREFAIKDQEHIEDKTSHVSDAMDQKLTVTEIHDELDKCKSSNHFVPRKSNLPRSHTSQYKGHRWSLLSYAPSKLQWGGLL